MNTYVADTSIFLTYIRVKPLREYLQREFQLFRNTATTIISPVVIGELRALSIKQQWGKNRWRLLDELLENTITVDLNQEPVLDAYANLSAYAEGKHPEYSEKRTSETVGKNDLWIAATALVTGSTLVTSDKDFLIFDPTFMEVRHMDAETTF